MRAKVWLRVACVFILIHLIGHGIGHSMWDKPEDPRMQAVVDTMAGYDSEFMGATWSMADYYNGYSLILFFVYALSISIIWFTSNAQPVHHPLVKRILYPMAFAWIAFGVIEFIYFFPFAASISLGAGLLILAAMFRLEVGR